LPQPLLGEGKVMLVEAVRFVVAVVLIVSVPMLVWTIAEKFDDWRAGRHRNTPGDC
jgi:nitric oxide reductase large subunit